MTYAEVYSRLNFETAVITFFKKDGTVRIMLGTRNLETVSLQYGFQGIALGGHDNRCNIGNGNVAVFDLSIGDARSFNINRLVDIQWVGVISTKEEYDKVFESYVDYKKKYEETMPKTIDFDSIEVTGGNQ